MAYRIRMKFTLQSDAHANLVRSCTATEIHVHDQVIRASAILSADQLVLDWAPHTIGALRAEHLEPVLALAPELILLGTGERQQFPDASVARAAQKAGVGFEVMDTRAACRTYNVLVQEGRRVAAAILMEGSVERTPGEDTGNKSSDHQPIIRS
jgi:uncharacterized protein